MRAWMTIVVVGALLACARDQAPPPPPVPTRAAPPAFTLAGECDMGRGGSATEWNCTADALNDEGRVRESRRAYRRALVASGDDAGQRAYALGGIAVTSARLGDCDDAESAVGELRQLQPGNALARLANPVCESLRRLAGE